MHNQKLYKRMLASTTAAVVMAGAFAPAAVFAVTGWQQQGSTWRYLENDVAATGWRNIGGVWYYFDADGTMATGWRLVNGYWYYLNDSGAMATGWANVNGSWFFLEDSGAMATGWLFKNDNWFYLDESGVMAVGWKQIDGAWYRFDGNGYMLTGWTQSSGDWYYLSTIHDGGYGAMLTDTVTPDGYTVDKDGKWVESPQTAEIVNGSYNYFIFGDDWGAGVDKLEVNLDKVVSNVGVDDLVVTETKQATNWTKEGFPVEEVTVPRTVKSVEYIDDEGKPSETPTKHLLVKLAISPDEGSPFLFTMSTMYNTWSDPYYLTVATAEGSDMTVDGKEAKLEVKTKADHRVTYADTQGWKFGTDTQKEITYNYAAWDPEEESDTLVVWLHGMGEGGTKVLGSATDPYVTILANKVTALADDDFQETVGGAHIVAPQCPTMWMDIDGNGKMITTENSTEVKSYYTDSLEAFIDAYAEKVGAKKIVLAGCSNGGFMTLWLALHRPTAYTAIVPICEAVPDSLIKDEQIAAVKDLPMYFVWSDDDDTVDPTKHEIPTVERLKEAGATEIHTSTSDHVIDLSHRFDDEEGNPYQYNGHWSWIYFDNDETSCDQDNLTAWDFIASHVSDQVVVNGTYKSHITGDDWGAGVDKMEIKFDKKLDKLEAGDLKITEVKNAPDYAGGGLMYTERKVTKVTPADDGGYTYLVELEISPSTGSPLVWNMGTLYNEPCETYELDVAVADDAALTVGGKKVRALAVNKKATWFDDTVDEAKFDATKTWKTSQGITYNYAEFKPAGGSKNLVVWLHGMGEGGYGDPTVQGGVNTDPWVTLMANKVTALAGDEFQTVVGGANILVPQCPTYWMDKDGTAANKQTRLDSDGSSYYTESLHELIADYAKQVGADKIVLAGASNGGYMVLNLIKAYPNEYVAGVPISETIQDKYLADNEIANLATTPLYFMYCMADTTAVASNCSIPTIARIKAVGGTAEACSFETIQDTSGRFKKDDGTPYEYSGHWAWVHFDNNYVADKNLIQPWQFIASNLGVEEQGGE